MEKQRVKPLVWYLCLAKWSLMNGRAGVPHRVTTKYWTLIELRLLAYLFSHASPVKWVSLICHCENDLLYQIGSKFFPCKLTSRSWKASTKQANRTVGLRTTKIFPESAKTWPGEGSSEPRWAWPAALQRYFKCLLVEPDSSVASPLQGWQRLYLSRKPGTPENFSCKPGISHFVPVGCLTVLLWIQCHSFYEKREQNVAKSNHRCRNKLRRVAQSLENSPRDVLWLCLLLSINLWILFCLVRQGEQKFAVRLTTENSIEKV